jgi:hypothetical protein
MHVAARLTVAALIGQQLCQEVASPGDVISRPGAPKQLVVITTPSCMHVMLVDFSCCSWLWLLTDTIYFPALHSLVEDLNTTETMGAASVSVYLFAVGLTALVWGPFSGKHVKQQ